MSLNFDYLLIYSGIIIIVAGILAMFVKNMLKLGEKSLNS